MLFQNKYKGLYEEQKRLTDLAIKTAQGWKEEAEKVTRDYEKVVRVDYPEIVSQLKKIIEKNNALTLELALYKSNRGNGQGGVRHR